MSEENKKLLGNQQLISNAVEHLATVQTRFSKHNHVLFIQKRQPQIKTKQLDSKQSWNAESSIQGQYKFAQNNFVLTSASFAHCSTFFRLLEGEKGKLGCRQKLKYFCRVVNNTMIKHYFTIALLKSKINCLQIFPVILLLKRNNPEEFQELPQTSREKQF